MAKMRSPNYPAIGLNEAIQRVRMLWAKEKRTAVPYDVAAKAIGYSGLSGPSRTAIASLKKYGLVDTDERTVRVSDLAMRALHASDDEQLLALRDAALRPELFAQLYETHALASDDALRSHLITKLDFSEVGAKQLIKAFRDTIAVAKLEQTEYIPQAGASIAATMQAKEINDLKRNSSMTLNAQTLPIKDTYRPSTPSQTISVPLADSVFAEVRIAGDDMRPEYIEALKQYLDVYLKITKKSTNSALATEESGGSDPV